MTDTAYAISHESWHTPHGTVWACFELSDCDAPILRGIKSAGPALAWRDADALNRFVVPFTIDHEAVKVEEQPDLFSISGVTL